MEQIMILKEDDRQKSNVDIISIEYVIKTIHQKINTERVVEQRDGDGINILNSFGFILFVCRGKLL